MKEQPNGTPGSNDYHHSLTSATSPSNFVQRITIEIRTAFFKDAYRRRTFINSKKFWWNL